VKKIPSDFERLYKESKLGNPVVIAVEGKGEKVIGSIHDRKFIKVVRKSKHFLHTPPAIGIDQEVFQRIIADQCDNIFILEMEAKDVYSSSVEYFLKHAIYLNRGFGGQLALPMHLWGRNQGVVKQTKML
jgi:hypothetical protein